MKIIEYVRQLEKERKAETRKYDFLNPHNVKQKQRYEIDYEFRTKSNSRIYKHSE